MPKMLIDENVPRSVVDWLKKKGFIVTSVFETNLKGSKDHAVADYALKNNLIILTLDNDFARMHHTLVKGALSVVVIRAKPSTPSNIIGILGKALPKLKFDEIEGKLVIISKKRIKIVA